jgi:hypothetical protein
MLPYKYKEVKLLSIAATRTPVNKIIFYTTIQTTEIYVVSSVRFLQIQIRAVYIELDPFHQPLYNLFLSSLDNLQIKFTCIYLLLTFRTIRTYQVKSRVNPT